MEREELEAMSKKELVNRCFRLQDSVISKALRIASLGRQLEDATTPYMEDLADVTDPEINAIIDKLYCKNPKDQKMVKIG